MWFCPEGARLISPMILGVSSLYQWKNSAASDLLLLVPTETKLGRGKQTISGQDIPVDAGY